MAVGMGLVTRNGFEAKEILLQLADDAQPNMVDAYPHSYPAHQAVVRQPPMHILTFLPPVTHVLLQVYFRDVVLGCARLLIHAQSHFDGYTSTTAGLFSRCSSG